MDFNGKKRFPCTVCLRPFEVRQSKKSKPYVICEPCGVQMFVRLGEGIQAFSKLVEKSDQEDIWTRFRTLVDRYQKTCPECGQEFWIEPCLVQTDWFDGSLVGFRCPNNKCKAVIPWEGRKK